MLQLGFNAVISILVVMIRPSLLQRFPGDQAAAAVVPLNWPAPCSARRLGRCVSPSLVGLSGKTPLRPRPPSSARQEALAQKYWQ